MRYFLIPSSHLEMRAVIGPRRLREGYSTLASRLSNGGVLSRSSDSQTFKPPESVRLPTVSFVYEPGILSCREEGCLWLPVSQYVCICSCGGGLGERYLWAHLPHISKLIVLVKMGVLGSAVLGTGNYKQMNCGRFLCALT